MKNELRDVMNKRFSKKSDSHKTLGGFLGNGYSLVAVENMPDYVYVTLYDGTIVKAFNKVAPQIMNLPVQVGYAEDQYKSKLFEVLSVRNIPRYGATDQSYHVDNHHASHEWMYPGGGTDITYIHLRQLMPLRPTVVSSYKIYVNPAVIELSNGTFVTVGNLTTDLSTYVPKTQDPTPISGSALPARYALMSVSAISGSIVTTSGSLKTVGTLLPSDIPTVPSQNYPICAVRLYTWQKNIAEGRTNTDLVDLRWGMFQSTAISGSGGGIPEAPIDGSDYARKDASWDKVVTPINTPAVPGFYLTGYSGSSGAFTSGSISSSGSGGGIPEAPNDGLQYGRQSLGWTAITSGSGGAISGSGVQTIGTVSDNHLAIFSGSSGNYIKDAGVLFPQRASLWHDEISIVSGGPIIFDHDTNQNYATAPFQSTHADGDSFTQSFFLSSGSYTFNVLGITGTNDAIIDWYIDNILVVNQQDWYSGSRVNNVIKTNSISIVGTGRHVLKGVINGKSGIDYYMQLTKYWFNMDSETILVY